VHPVQHFGKYLNFPRPPLTVVNVRWLDMDQHSPWRFPRRHGRRGLLNDRISRQDTDMKTKCWAILKFAFFTAALPVLAIAQQIQTPGGPQQAPWDWSCHGHMWSGGWGFWWMFPLFILFMIMVCVAIFFLGRRSGGGHHHWGPWHMMDRARSWGDPTDSALRILNERFARGEIQQQEYEEKKAVILSSGQH
jgi:putative membrane protein